MDFIKNYLKFAPKEDEKQGQIRKNNDNVFVELLINSDDNENLSTKINFNKINVLKKNLENKIKELINSIKLTSDINSEQNRMILNNLKELIKNLSIINKIYYRKNVLFEISPIFNEEILAKLELLKKTFKKEVDEIYDNLYRIFDDHNPGFVSKNLKNHDNQDKVFLIYNLLYSSEKNLLEFLIKHKGGYDTLCKKILELDTRKYLKIINRLNNINVVNENKLEFTTTLLKYNIVNNKNNKYNTCIKQLFKGYSESAKLNDLNNLLEIALISNDNSAYMLLNTIIKRSELIDDKKKDEENTKILSTLLEKLIYATVSSNNVNNIKDINFIIDVFSKNPKSKKILEEIFNSINFPLLAFADQNYDMCSALLNLCFDAANDNDVLIDPIKKTYIYNLNKGSTGIKSDNTLMEIFIKDLYSHKKNEEVLDKKEQLNGVEKILLNILDTRGLEPFVKNNSIIHDDITSSKKCGFEMLSEIIEGTKEKDVKDTAQKIVNKISNKIKNGLSLDFLKDNKENDLKEEGDFINTIENLIEISCKLGDSALLEALFSRKDIPLESWNQNFINGDNNKKNHPLEILYQNFLVSIAFENLEDKNKAKVYLDMLQKYYNNLKELNINSTQVYIYNKSLASLILNNGDIAKEIKDNIMNSIIDNKCAILNKDRLAEYRYDINYNVEKDSINKSLFLTIIQKGEIKLFEKIIKERKDDVDFFEKSEKDKNIYMIAACNEGSVEDRLKMLKKIHEIHEEYSKHEGNKDYKTKIPKINDRDKDGNTAMHYALINGDEESIKYLDTIGAKYDKNIFLSLSQNKNFDFLKKCIKGGVVIKYTKIEKGKSNREIEKEISRKFVNEKDVKNLIKIKDKDNNSLLHYAIMHNNDELIKYLLINKKNFNIDINASNKKGITPLMLAARYQKNDILSLLQENEELNINAQDKDGNTALHFTVKTGDFSNIENLLNNKRINPNICNKKGHNVFTTYLYSEKTEVKDEILNKEIGLNNKEINLAPKDGADVKITNNLTKLKYDPKILTMMSDKGCELIVTDGKISFTLKLILATALYGLGLAIGRVFPPLKSVALFFTSMYAAIVAGEKAKEVVSEFLTNSMSENNNIVGYSDHTCFIGSAFDAKDIVGEKYKKHIYTENKTFIYTHNDLRNFIKGIEEFVKDAKEDRTKNYLGEINAKEITLLRIYNDLIEKYDKLEVLKKDKHTGYIAAMHYSSQQKKIQEATRIISASTPFKEVYNLAYKYINSENINVIKYDFTKVRKLIENKSSALVNQLIYFNSIQNPDNSLDKNNCKKLLNFIKNISENKFYVDVEFRNKCKEFILLYNTTTQKDHIVKQKDINKKILKDIDDSQISKFYNMINGVNIENSQKILKEQKQKGIGCGPIIGKNEDTVVNKTFEYTLGATNYVRQKFGYNKYNTQKEDIEKVINFVSNGAKHITTVGVQDILTGGMVLRDMVIPLANIALSILSSVGQVASANPAMIGAFCLAYIGKVSFYKGADYVKKLADEYYAKQKEDVEIIFQYKIEYDNKINHLNQNIIDITKLELKNKNIKEKGIDGKNIINIENHNVNFLKNDIEHQNQNINIENIEDIECNPGEKMQNINSKEFTEYCKNNGITTADMVCAVMYLVRNVNFAGIKDEFKIDDVIDKDNAHTFWKIFINMMEDTQSILNLGDLTKSLLLEEKFKKFRDRYKTVMLDVFPQITFIGFEIARLIDAREFKEQQDKYNLALDRGENQ